MSESVLSLCYEFGFGDSSSIRTSRALLSRSRVIPIGSSVVVYTSSFMYEESKECWYDSMGGYQFILHRHIVNYPLIIVVNKWGGTYGFS